MTTPDKPYPASYAISRVLYDVLKERGDDMRFYRVAGPIPVSDLNNEMLRATRESQGQPMDAKSEAAAPSETGDAPENIIDNPKSWAAWKREADSWRRVAERLEAEKQAVASTATEARAYLVCNPMIPKQPLAKGKGKFPDADEWLYPARREADARSMARLVRGDLIPLYGKDETDE
jgi:hypothetical protein